MRYSILERSIPALISALVLCAAPSIGCAAVSIGISVNVAPPVLPVYVQPPVPAPGYIWTPGYWGWADGGYYWVPGTWVEPPEVGFLWTPGYWGWNDGSYLWHAGYWGPHVGFYGGVNYGYGYTGVGFEGGYWRDRQFYYNRSVANIRSANIKTVYNKTVINNVTVNRVSYNGGHGGLATRPRPEEEAAARDHHVAFTSDQEKHEHLAAGDRQLRAAVNHGRPAVAATARPAVFTGSGVVPAHGINPAHGTNNGTHAARAAHTTAAHTTVDHRAPIQPQHEVPHRPDGGSSHIAPPAHISAPAHMAPPPHVTAQPHEGGQLRGGARPPSHGEGGQPHGNEQQQHNEQPHNEPQHGNDERR